MARQTDDELTPIEAIVAAHPNGIGIREIENSLEGEINRRTLQNRLKRLVDGGRLVKEGEKRWAKYKIAGAAGTEIPGSKRAAMIRRYVRQPIEARQPVGYNRRFLNAYRPNESHYLSERERIHLTNKGSVSYGEAPAGTYAKHILNRVLIDLSWNSSRLEGNTYSLLDTKRLIAFGEEAEGREHLEAQMILNHKDAIEFLVGAADEIGFNRYTILNLHALLANNLLANPEAAGRLRHIGVGIEKSVFHPLELPQLIEECFDQMLSTAEAIRNPFEQSFFIMAHLPYLQPFDDVNKRVSRLAANIPFIKANLTPLSFNDVPAEFYTEAILGVYELNETDLLKDVFIWAYERSAARYAAVRQSLGEPDPFRLKYRAVLHELVREIVLGPQNRKSAFAQIEQSARKNVEAGEQERFRETAENEILGLHEGNFARYRIKPSEFERWRTVWNSKN